MKDHQHIGAADGLSQPRHQHVPGDDLDPEAPRSPRKSHKSSKHSKKSKHKSRKDRERAHSSSDEQHVSKAARHRRSKDGVGSDPEDGEILVAGTAVEGQLHGSFVAPVTDKPTSGRVPAELTDDHGRAARTKQSDAAVEAHSSLAVPEHEMGEPADLNNHKRPRKRERALDQQDGGQAQAHLASEHDAAPRQPKQSRLGPGADVVSHPEVAPVRKPVAGSNGREELENGAGSLSPANGLQGPGEEVPQEDTKDPRDDRRGGPDGDSQSRHPRHSRERGKERERDRDKDKDRDRPRERDRDRDRGRATRGRSGEREDSRSWQRSRERPHSPDGGRGWREPRARERSMDVDRGGYRDRGSRLGDRDRGVSDRGGERERERSRGAVDRPVGRMDDWGREDVRGRGRGGADLPRSDDARRRDDRERYDRQDRDRGSGRRGHEGSLARGGDEQRGKEEQKKPNPQEEPEDEVVGLLDEDPEAAELRAIEERRKRLAEIKAKHTQQQAFTEAVINPTKTALTSPQTTFAFQNATPAVSGAPAGAADITDTAADQPQPTSTLGQGGPEEGGDQADGEKTPEGDRTSSSDDGNVVDGPVLDIWGNEVPQDEVESRPAADNSVAPSGAPGLITEAERVQATAATTAKQQLPIQAEDEEDDMFAIEEPDDAGADNKDGEGDQQEDAALKAAGLRLNGPAAALKKKGAAGALADQYDDLEGYYNFQVGEIMDKRYEVFASYGKGVFGVVVRARDVQRVDDQGRPQEVAIKLIRSNETMYKASQTELSVLRKIAAADPENKKHCIKLLRHFEYRNHMCLVFEPMAMNLRDLTKKVGRNKGLNIEAVQLFTCQLLIALRHLKKNQVLHADIKPDNILINHRHNKVKICDFGSAMMAGDNDVTPYLVSRFYRPPEVVLGMKYDYAMDMWSIGCVVYELFTGRILFPGHSNNEMLKLMMDVKGAFKKNMLKTRCKFAEQHFDVSDSNFPFISLEDDPITKTKVRKLIHNPTVKSGFTSLLAKCSGDKAKIGQLADLLDKMMMLEPERRIDPDGALRHPFVKEFLPRKEPGHKKGKHGVEHPPVVPL